MHAQNDASTSHRSCRTILITRLGGCNHARVVDISIMTACQFLMSSDDIKTELPSQKRAFEQNCDHLHRSHDAACNGYGAVQSEGDNALFI